MKVQKLKSYILVFSALLLLLSIAACSSKILKKDNSEQLLKSDEYDKAVSISKVQGPTGRYVKLGPSEYQELYGNRNNSKTKVIKIKPTKTQAKIKAEIGPPPPLVHQPSFEDAESFNQRRPVVDPFRVGEKMTFEVSYFGVVAGEMSMKVLPFIYVNGRKSYHFAASGQTVSVFEMFYAVDDWLETFVDFENLIPMSYALHVKESKQLRETRCFFNWQTHKGSYWDKRVTKEDGVEEKKYEWDILDYSQNIFSAPFYLRNFKLEVGKKLVYRLAHEKENILVTAEVLRREKLKTQAGEFDAIVLQPHIEIGGVFKPIGDIFLWLSDDDRKFILRIESKIKIGKIVAEIKSLERGDEKSILEPTPSPAPSPNLEAEEKPERAFEPVKNK